MSKEEYTYAIGRRKTSTATVRLYQKSGAMLFNGKDVNELQIAKIQTMNLFKPFSVADLKAEDFMVTFVANGGGITGQIEAARLALARAIQKVYPEKRKALKDAGLLVRDPRMVERKKTGLRKARKSEQFSKR